MISLVSEQTVPNILAIWHFRPQKLLFVSSKAMENKHKVIDIIGTLSHRESGFYQLDINAEVIIVAEDSLYDGLRKLEQWIQGRDDQTFIVNLTGGTKMMSIAVFEIFKKYKSRMIYIPINKSEFISLFPISSPEPSIPLTHRLKVHEYLCAYGLATVNDDKVTRNALSAKHLKDDAAWIVEHYIELKDLLSHIGQMLREYRKRKLFNFSTDFNIENDIQSDFFKRFSFKQNSSTYSKVMDKDDIAFFTGGWLEIFCYNCVADLCGCGVDDAVININIKNNRGSENEFDVMFTSQNALYFIECKSLEQNHVKQFGVQSMYKIGALQKEFGLRVQSYLVTTSSQIMDPKTGGIKQHIQERAEQFATRIICAEQIKDFKNILVEHIPQLPQENIV
jgi:hypothetical protein